MVLPYISRGFCLEKARPSQRLNPGAGAARGGRAACLGGALRTRLDGKGHSWMVDHNG